MKLTSTNNPALLGVAVALSIGLTIVELAVSQAQGQLRFDCEQLAGNCTREIPEYDEGAPNPVQVSLEVPDGECVNAARVGAAIEIDHTWIGDLRVELIHELSNSSVILINRPGANTIGEFGCPGVGIDVDILDSDGRDRADDDCRLTIPSIVGTRAASAYSTSLVIDPSDPPSFDGCAFERFEGKFLPSGGATACGPFTDSSIDCEFRGRYNDSCGGEVTVRVTIFEGRAILQIDEESPAQFVADVESATTASLSIFEVIASREVSGLVEMGNSGLTVLDGVPCAGTWTLAVEDLAAPHAGRVTNWALLLLPEDTPTPTATHTATPSSTATATHTATPSSTATATHSATPSSTATVTHTATPTSSPNATPSETSTNTPTEATTATPTASPDLTASQTPTESAATETPVPGTPTDTPAAGTPTATSPTETPGEGTPTDTPVTETPAPGTPTDTPATETPTITCVGDCDGDGMVSISELIRGVNIALELAALDTCAAFDRNGNGAVEISELIAAVNNALDGCG